MTLFEFTYQDMRFELTGSHWTGLEIVLIDGQEVSRKRNFRFSGSHTIVAPRLGAIILNFKFDSTFQAATYQLLQGGQVLTQDTVDVVKPAWLTSIDRSAKKDTDTESDEKEAGVPQKRGHLISWMGLVVKLFKSVKVIKVTLAGAAFSGWSLIYSWEFAAILIAVIVFHEYGHLRAMRRYRIPTKGMYLIPFFGGVAVGDRAKTQWQDVYISMMGPIYGLVMTIVFYVIYLVSENHFAGLIASLSALINVFNLLPIYPLDGGRVVKALVFSGRKYWGFLCLLIMSALCFALSVMSGLVLLSFFVVIGVVDLVASWRDFSRENKAPLQPYGIGVSLLWYLGTIGVFLAVIYGIAASGLPGAELATNVLES